MYDRDLEKDVMSETSGNYKRLLVSMLQGGRDENTAVDMEKAKYV
jgi:annexin A7/11